MLRNDLAEYEIACHSLLLGSHDMTEYHARFPPLPPRRMAGDHNHGYSGRLWTDQE